MENMTEQKNLFENTKISKLYFRFAIPVVLGFVVSLVYNMVDTYFISFTGDTDLIAGVSICSPIFTLMIALGDIMGLGGSSLISRLLGEGKEKLAKQISVFCFYGALGIGFVVLALLLIFKYQVIYLIGADEATVQHALGYYTYLAIGAPIIIVNFTPNNQLRCEGLTKASMAGSIIGTVVNIILDPIFILTLHMGASGAAIATVLGNLSTFIYYLYTYIRRSKCLSVNIGLLSINLRDIKDILKIGFPASITNLMQSFALMMTNRSLLNYGNDKIAAAGVASKIIMIVSLILVGFAFGGQPIYGYNYGSKNHKRFKESVRFGYIFILSLSVVLSGIMAFMSVYLISMFDLTAEVADIAVFFLRIQLIGIVFMTFVLQTTCLFQSTGKGVGAFILSLFRQGLVFAVCLFVLERYYGYMGILFAQPLSDFITAITAAVLYKVFLGTGSKPVISHKE